jgi:hypothetical protein
MKQEELATSDGDEACYDLGVVEADLIMVNGVESRRATVSSVFVPDRARVLLFDTSRDRISFELTPYTVAPESISIEDSEDTFQS